MRNHPFDFIHTGAVPKFPYCLAITTWPIGIFRRLLRAGVKVGAQAQKHNAKRDGSDGAGKDGMCSIGRGLVFPTNNAVIDARRVASPLIKSHRSVRREIAAGPIAARP